MRVELLYPGITECGFGGLRGNEGTWMNHGLAILSSALQDAGHEVGLTDLRRLSGWEEFRERVRKSHYSAVGISMMSVDFDPGTKAARIIKEVRPEVKVFVGGPHASVCPEELTALDFVDCVVKGEGEITFPGLIGKVERGEEIPKFVEGEHLMDLDESPWADRSLFGCMEEPFVDFLPPPFVTLIAGRGCRYNCSYCQPAERAIFGRNVRRRSVDNVISELKELKKTHGFRSWMLHDDCITEDREWVMEFVRQYRGEGFTEPFVCQSRADLVCRNKPMIRALSRAGLRLMIIGFESGSNRVLRYLRKGCTREQNLQAARICTRYGIKIWANYMLGLPTETNEEVLETFSMLEEIAPYHCSPAFYTPHPGSDLYEMGRKLGIHLITSHAEYRRNTYEPKIKGPDYDFLTKILHKSIALGEDAGALRRVAAGHPRMYSLLASAKHTLQRGLRLVAAAGRD